MNNHLDKISEDIASHDVVPFHKRTSETPERSVVIQFKGEAPTRDLAFLKNMMTTSTTEDDVYDLILENVDMNKRYHVGHIRIHHLGKYETIVETLEGKATVKIIDDTNIKRIPQHIIDSVPYFKRLSEDELESETTPDIENDRWRMKHKIRI